MCNSILAFFDLDDIEPLDHSCEYIWTWAEHFNDQGDVIEMAIVFYSRPSLKY